MVSCALCGRRLLIGERFHWWTVESRGPEHSVCPLCEGEAAGAGWVMVERPAERTTTVGPTWHARRKVA